MSALDTEYGAWLDSLALPENIDDLTPARDFVVDIDDHCEDAGAKIFSPARKFEIVAPDVSNVRPIQWVWQDRIPKGALSLVVGDEGSGKSTLAAHVIANVTRGTLDGNLAGPGNVLILADEDGRDLVWTPRLIAAGANLERVRFMLPADVGPLDIRHDAEHLTAAIREHGFELVFFDQLIDHIEDSVNTNKDTKGVRRALGALGSVARDCDVAITGTLHTNKLVVGTFRQKITGVQAFNAVSRCSLFVGYHPEDASLPDVEQRRVVARGKGNWSAAPDALAFRLESVTEPINGFAIETLRAADFESAGRLTADDLSRQAQRAEAPVRDDLRETLAAVLSSEGQSMAAVLQAAGRRRDCKTGRKTLDEMLVDGEAAKEGALWYAPEGGTTPTTPTTQLKAVA